MKLSIFCPRVSGIVWQILNEVIAVLLLILMDIHGCIDRDQLNRFKRKTRELKNAQELLQGISSERCVNRFLLKET